MTRFNLTSITFFILSTFDESTHVSSKSMIHNSRARTVAEVTQNYPMINIYDKILGVDSGNFIVIHSFWCCYHFELLSANKGMGWSVIRFAD